MKRVPDAFLRRLAAAAVLAAPLLFAAPALSAQQADVTYVDGSVDLQPVGQDRTSAEIGDQMNLGDSIITGSDGNAQLQQSDMSEVNVSPGTVFTLRQMSNGTTKQDVLEVALGSISFSFKQLGGNEPAIATPSASAGIRGTDVTVYAGADGSSLFIVTAGQVAVNSSGKSVLLTPNEGVEVNPGQPPGEKFTVLRGQVDYSTWNKQKIQNVLLDPVGSAQRVEAQMKDYVKQLDELLPKYRETKAQLDANREQMKVIAAQQGKDAQQKYYAEKVFPLEVLASSQFLNVRYYALSALSLKRYVLGRMYIQFASMYISDRNNDVYRGFLEVYRRTVSEFNASVVPYLVAADL